MQKVISGQIHRCRNRNDSFFHDLYIVFANLFKHIEIQLTDLAGFLQNRDKLSRRNHAADRINPPCQCLTIAHCSGHGADDRLIIDMNPAIFQCLVKIPHNMEFHRIVFLNIGIKPCICRDRSPGKGFTGQPGFITGIRQPGVRIVIFKDAGLHRQIIAVTKLIHPDKQVIQLFFNLVIFCIDGKVVTFKPGSSVPAKIRFDQFTKSPDLPVTNLKAIPAVIFLQSTQIKIHDDRHLILCPDLFNAGYGIIEKMRHILQSGQAVIMLCKFCTFRRRILVRQRCQHCREQLVLTRICRLICIRDKSNISTIYRNIFTSRMNQMIILLILAAVSEHNIIVMLMHGKVVSTLLHPRNIIRMHIPIEIPAKTIHRFLTAAVSKKAEICPGNKKRPDLFINVLIHRNRNRDILDKCTCIIRKRIGFHILFLPSHFLLSGRLITDTLLWLTE